MVQYNREKMNVKKIWKEFWQKNVKKIGKEILIKNKFSKNFFSKFSKF